MKYPRWHFQLLSGTDIFVNFISVMVPRHPRACLHDFPGMSESTTEKHALLAYSCTTQIKHGKEVMTPQ